MLNKLNKLKVGTILEFYGEQYTVLKIVDQGLFQSSHDELGTVPLMLLESVKIITKEKIFNIYEIMEAYYE